MTHAGRAADMTFSEGDPVLVRSLGRGVVREVRSGGRYLVEVKGTSMLVTGGLLAPAPARDSRPGRTAPADPGVAPVSRTPGPASHPPTLDLHGKTVPEALDSLEAFLNRALLDNAPEVRIVHGRSGGRLKAAVHGRLRQLPPVRHFRIDPANPGVTIATL